MRGRAMSASLNKVDVCFKRGLAAGGDGKEEITNRLSVS